MNGTNQKNRKRRVAIFVGIAVLLGWLCYAAVFIYRINRGGDAVLTPEVQRLAMQEFQEEWFTIYQHGRRAGYSHIEIRPQEEGYVLIEELFLRLDFLENIQDLVSWVQATLAPDFSLKTFTFRLRAGPISYNLRGGVKDESLILVSRMAGQEQTQRLPLSQPIYLSSAIKSFISQQQMHVGNTYTLALFDPATMSQTMVPLRVEARESVRIGSRNLDAYRIVMEFHGIQLRAWISPYGELLKEEGFLGMTMVRTDREDAIKGISEATAAEWVREASVVPDRPIVGPRHLKSLRLELTGISGDGWDLAGGRQQWDEGQLAIVRESLPEIASVKIPYRTAELAQDLQPSLLIQSDTLILQEQAASIVGEEKDALRAVALISSWVYNYLEKRPTLSIPNALEVYKRRAGDCNEHSVLFAALARAAGIPTRVAAGLLYAEGRFFYHAWDEVFVGEWVAVDPLMNQVPADPTHIRLILGELDRQVQLVRVLGRLGIKVIDYE